MSDIIHPAHLLKQVVAYYLSKFVPPGSDAVYTKFGGDIGIPVIEDEDQNAALSASGPDVLVWENAASEEIAEGAGVWKINLAVTLAVPGDWESGKFDSLDQALWQYLSGGYPGDVSSGGDVPGPLAGRLTAASAAAKDEDPDKFPRLLCVGDVWQLKRTPPELDSPGLRVMIYTLTAIAEVMPSDFAPAL